MTAMNIAADLAARLDGTVRDNDLILVPTHDGMHVIDCRPTGRVYLDGRWPLGSLSDGADYLAAKYQAAVMEPCS